MSTPATTNSSSIAHTFASTPVTVLLAIVFLVFFFICFFSVYCCPYFVNNLAHTFTLARTISNTNSPPPPPPGLRLATIESFPTFPYSAVKPFRRDKFGLECAICLSEFHHQALLRLLIPCYHIFHRDCIDLWLDTKTTCPVCRRSLDSPVVASQDNDSVVIDMDEGDEFKEEDEECDDDDDDDTFSIDLKKGNDVVVARKNVCACVSHNGRMQRNYSYERDNLFPRSFSTGHRTKGGEDRFTLRLPDHVKLKIGKGGGGSCVSSRRGGSREIGAGETSGSGIEGVENV